MGFANTNWNEVEPAGNSRTIPAGGYVARITAVEDVERSEYLRFTFDIAEGEYKGFFEDDDRPYTHQFVRSYKPKAMGFMRRFLDCVDESNPNFSLAGWDNNPQALVGKLVGVVIQREDYTNKKGEDRSRMNVEEYASAPDIRAGRFKLPEPKDSREKTQGTDGGYGSTDAQHDVAGSVYDADIPF